MLLSTTNLQVRGTPAKLKRKFAGPFRITECIGSQSYRLDLPTTWRVHNVFYVSLLKIWREDMYRRYPAPEPTRLEEEDDQEVTRLRNIYVGGIGRFRTERKESS